MNSSLLLYTLKSSPRNTACRNVHSRLRINIKTPHCRRANSTQAQATSTTPESLSWPEYLRIRKNKRKWEMAATLPSVMIGFGAGALYFGSQEIDAAKPVFGFDPLYVYAFATLACGGAGYLVGPAIGQTMWRLTHRRTMALIEARDREFHHRIVKNRVDPTAQSATNPVPDFYGEKIGSLHQYRQWLRDQSRYKKKAKWLEE